MYVWQSQLRYSHLEHISSSACLLIHVQHTTDRLSSCAAGTQMCTRTCPHPTNNLADGNHIYPELPYSNICHHHSGSRIFGLTYLQVLVKWDC